MNVFKHILNFYINSSIHVALSVFSLSWITLIEFELPYDGIILYFIFFSTITGYNFIKYFGLAKFHHRRLASWLKVIQLFSLISFMLLCYYALKLETKTVLYLGGFGIVTFLYAMPFLPKKMFVDKEQNLRSISGLKIYVIAMVWSGVTVLIPLINSYYSLTTDVFLTAIQRFIFVLVLMLPFEVRDMQYDSLKLSTIPQQIGEKKTKIIGVLLIMLFFFLEFFKDELNSKQIIVMLVVTIITFMFLVFAKRTQGKYYSSFWVESIPIFWLLMMIN